jgi:hypothetical protein
MSYAKHPFHWELQDLFVSSMAVFETFFPFGEDFLQKGPRCGPQEKGADEDPAGYEKTEN